MTSFRGRFFNLMIRNRHLLQGRLKKEVFDSNTSIPDFRARCEKSAARYLKIPAGVDVREEIIRGMKCEWLRPVEADPGSIILYVHGGGYVSGSCNDHRGFVSRFSQFTGITNLVYEYRLAPENPFPAALEDSLNIYQWLIESGYEPGKIIIAGESAGGGLTLALLLALKESDFPLPASAVAISPWTNLTCSGNSYKTKNKLSAAPMNSWKVFSRYYCGDHSATDPLISPMFGNLRGLPPIFINSAVDDELFDDGREFFERARLAGVDITFRAGNGMVHCYPLMAPMFREATEAMNEIVGFVRKHMATSSQKATD